MQHAQLKGKLKANLFSEIDILKRIHHPHIVGLINILESANHIHLVMEYCQLGDMACFVRKRDKLASHPVTAEMMRNYPNPPGLGFNEVVVRHFAKQLASAMEFLQSKNLVHRDLKPQNLLLNPPPSWIVNEKPENRPFEVAANQLIPLAGLASMPVLKVGDFGFARHLPQTTMAETLCGSPLYMAPEILRYEKYDNKADLWSVGTVLYELNVGRPPFRASNHVELLRRIEKGMDRIDFPSEVAISKDMHQVICGLLRKMPTERISWEAFFNSAVIKDDIPGLVDADKPTAPVASAPNTDGRPPLPMEDLVDGSDAPLSTASSRPSAERTMSAMQAGQKAVNRRLSSVQQKRPNMPSHSTDTAIQVVRSDKHDAPQMEKKRSQDTRLAEAAPVKSEVERRRSIQRMQQERRARDERERAAAQDVAFERDYVMVEKRAVEVNAFADEMAASPRIQNATRHSPTSQVGTMVRRATTQGLPVMTSGQASPSPYSQTAIRNDAAHQRRLSYERHGGERKMSTNSAITAALEKVQFRVPFLFSQGKGISPPKGYGPWPAFSAIPAGPLLLGDSTKPLALHEDQKVVSAIEEHATRSDVVFGFAEVKYKQLIPIAPSTDNRLGIYRTVARGDNEAPTAEDEDGLTADAIIGLSEEALVLYIKALAILTNTIGLAGNWWHQRGRGQSNIEMGVSPRGTESATDRNAENRINQVVQWARNRFNECLEKSEYSSRRLADAQRKLSSRASERSRSTASDMGDEKSPVADIRFTSGVTAGKLMYDRALDMSRSAAVNELVGEDLPGCEVSYTTAIRLLEGVLEEDEDATTRIDDDLGRERLVKLEEGDNAVDGIEEGDRKTVLKREYKNLGQ